MVCLAPLDAPYSLYAQALNKGTDAEIADAVPSVEQLQDATSQLSSKIGAEVHHLLGVRFQNKFGFDTKAEFNEQPGLLMSQVAHRGQNSLETEIFRAIPRQDNINEYERQDIVDLLEEAYKDAKRENEFQVLKAWLRSKGKI